jgi:hypothetical protein
MKRLCPTCNGWAKDLWNFCPYCGFSFGAERSGVLQECPPSASGSARSLAVEEERAKSGGESPSNQLADASDRSARPSDPAISAAGFQLVGAACQYAVAADWSKKWGDERTRFIIEELRYCSEQKLKEAAVDYFRVVCKPDAPPAAGERAVARNSD